MLRLEEKIAEGENKVYSMRSELSKVRRGCSVAVVDFERAWCLPVSVRVCGSDDE